MIKATDITPDQLKELTQIFPDTLPKELTQKNYNHWLNWNAVPDESKNKILKLPVHQTWQNKDYGYIFDDVIARVNSKGWGLGFKYTADHPFICIDIDYATPSNDDLMSLLNSYTEWSPSGKGLHIIIETDNKSELIKKFNKGRRLKKEARDLFIASGYVTITGNLIPISPKTVRLIPSADLISILEKYFLANIETHPAVQEKAQKDWEKAVNDNKKASTKKSRLTYTQVQNILEDIDVRTLEEDIFDRLRNGQTAVLDPNCREEARDPWMKIGAAIHHNFQGSLDGFMLWNNWSKRGEKYDEASCKSVWKSFKETNAESPITIATLIKLLKAQKPKFTEVNANGTSLPTSRNFNTYLNFYNFNITFNEVTKTLQVIPPKTLFKLWDWPEKFTIFPTVSQIAQYIQSDFIKLGFGQRAYSISTIEKYLTTKGFQNVINPLRDYFKGLSWDKEDRLDELVETLQIPKAYIPYIPAYKMFLRKWLIQVVAAACAHKPVRVNRVLIFQGPQGSGKTNWVASLFPSDLQEYCSPGKTLTLSQFKSDQVKLSMELANTLICNINEINRLFSSANFDQFKSFLDETVDSVVLPYGKEITHMQRRTVFIGSTNSESFLRDTTGNRRFEIIKCESLNFNHSVDIDQLWAQIFHYYKQGEKWWLDEDSETEFIKMRDELNDLYLVASANPVLEALHDTFDVDANIKDFSWLKFKDIRAALGLDGLKPNTTEFNEVKYTIEDWSRRISGEEPMNSDPASRKQRKPLLYKMPPFRQESSE